jgi:hypothetical protein
MGHEGRARAGGEEQVRAAAGADAGEGKAPGCRRALAASSVPARWGRLDGER